MPMDSTYDRDLELLPSRRLLVLGEAIGRKLIDVERRFWLPAEHASAEDYFRSHTPDADEEAWFGRLPGNTQLRFEGGVLHVLAPEPEWLSVLVLDEPLAQGDEWLGRLVCLSERPELERFGRCLKARCLDVRLWTLKDPGGPEPKECAVSYVLSSGLELVYGTWLDGQSDGDALELLEEPTPRLWHRVRSVAR